MKIQFIWEDLRRSTYETHGRGKQLQATFICSNEGHYVCTYVEEILTKEWIVKFSHDIKVVCKNP